MSVASGVSYASLIVLLRAQKDGSPMESALLGNVLTALIGLPFMFQGTPGAASWVGLILLGVPGDAEGQRLMVGTWDTVRKTADPASLIPPGELASLFSS